MTTNNTIATMPTIEEIEATYTLHHTASRRGYTTSIASSTTTRLMMDGRQPSETPLGASREARKTISRAERQNSAEKEKRMGANKGKEKYAVYCLKDGSYDAAKIIYVYADHHIQYIYTEDELVGVSESGKKKLDAAKAEGCVLRTKYPQYSPRLVRW